MRIFIPLLAALMLAMPARASEDIDIPYHRYVLDNGLRLVVHVDDKAPIVAVNVWYHVGSKNEQEGRTGFAHLFEHLMFNGSENHDDDWFGIMERIGATDLNGTTNSDRTNYFQNVPVTALDTALWMESDRMGHLLGAITQEKLDEQRGVVQNEKRQGENQPYGRVWETVFANVFPEGHPYSWPVIGYMEDLEAASLDDVHGWFREYYGAANAVIVVAGDVDPDDVHQRVQRYFGHIESGPPLTRREAWVARRTGEQRARMEDRVPQARIYRVFNVPELGDADGDYLDLVSSVLTSGRNSRLYERLVYNDRIATDVSSFVYQAEIAGLFIIIATAQPGGDLAAVEAAIDEEMARLLDRGITRSELERVKVGYQASFTRGIERIGGFGGISDVLASGEVYFNDPGQYRIRLDRIENASVADVNRVARAWLNDGAFNLEVHPFPQYQAGMSTVDRSSGPPMPDEFPTIDFPDAERMTLDNGMQVQLVRREAIPVVNMSLVFDAGYAADQSAVPGTASMVGAMLSEGTRRLNSLEISDRLQRLGASLSAGANVDMSYVGLSALRENIDDSMEIFADVVLNPSFPETEFDRLRQQRLAQIQRERVTPVQMALRVMPQLLYGPDHAYGQPLTGSGTTESVGAMDVESLRAFHQTWFRPNNSTLVVVGDITLDELRPRLERLFRRWEPAEVPTKRIDEVIHRDSPVVYIIDRPQSQQSIIFAGHIAPPKANDNEIAIMAMNDVLGGTFSSRINMNLRERRGWAYGASSFLFDARGQRPFIAYAPVQSDRTADSMQEIMNELTGIIGENPVTADELSKIVDDRTKSLPGRWETGNSVAGSLIESIRFGYEDDYWDRYAERFLALDRDDLQEAAASVLHPDRLVWVVVGDRASIEGPIRALNLGEIRFLDADGNPVE